MLTNKGKYGLKAMAHLAGLNPGELAQVADKRRIPSTREMSSRIDAAGAAKAAPARRNGKSPPVG